MLTKKNSYHKPLQSKLTIFLSIKKKLCKSFYGHKNNRIYEIFKIMMKIKAKLILNPNHQTKKTKI